MTDKKIGACILAAGYSSRMGAFKSLLPLGDKTVIETVLDTVKAAGIQKIAVVTGYNRQALQPLIQREKVMEAYNADFDRGMFSSIQAGVNRLPAGLDGFFLLPVDCPLPGQETLMKLAGVFVPGTDSFIVPCYRGKKGHPLLIPAYYRDEILRHDGEGGLKAITDRDDRKMMRIPVEQEGVLLDMDDQAGYAQVKAYLENGCRSEELAPLAEGRRFFLVRHGQIRQHKEKIFLGQTDVPLSEEGKRQAGEAAEALAKLAPDVERIYTSDLQRARETAQIIGRRMNRDIVQVSGLREMNLGPWDGKLISEIKKTYPREYEKRGRNLFQYKMGHRSENFYDLQYRVEKTMMQILKRDPSKDVVIVAHSGVLRGLYQNLQGLEIDQPWEKIENGKFAVVEVPSGL